MKKFWIFICALVVLAPALAYVLNFHECAISKDPSDWGTFGDFFGGIYSIIVTVFAVYLTNKLAKQNESRKRRNNAIEEIQNQILTIEKGKTIDARRVNRLFRLTHDNALYLPNSLIVSLKELGDNFLENKDDKDSIDKNLLGDIKEQLKRLYDE